jgi:hypothetical protein
MRDKTNSNAKNSKRSQFLARFNHLDFGFVSDFDVGILDFPRRRIDGKENQN